MRLVELYNKIKLLNTDKIVLIKSGSFYRTYGYDAIKCDLVNKKIENINIKVSQKIRDDINNYYKIDEFLNSI